MTEGHGKKGSDFVKITGMFADQALTVLFNTFSGRFIVEIDGDYVNERSSELDGTPWYDAVLDLVYVEKEPNQ